MALLVGRRRLDRPKDGDRVVTSGLGSNHVVYRLEPCAVIADVIVGLVWMRGEHQQHSIC